MPGSHQADFVNFSQLPLRADDIARPQLSGFDALQNCSLNSPVCRGPVLNIWHECRPIAVSRNGPALWRTESGSSNQSQVLYIMSKGARQRRFGTSSRIWIFLAPCLSN